MGSGSFQKTVEHPVRMCVCVNINTRVLCSRKIKHLHNYVLFVRRGIEFNILVRVSF